MHRSWFSNFASLALAAVVCAGAASARPVPAQVRPTAPTPAAPDTRLGAAVRAETDLRFDTAIGYLYEVLIEHPGTPDALDARLRLARLLALSGSIAPAMLECQLLRDELATDHPSRERALELSSLLLRRLRAANGQASSAFPTLEGLAARGLPTLDEPRAIAFESEGRFVLLDEGAGRVYRVTPDGASQIAAPAEASALTLLSDGTVLVAGKTGLATVPATRTFVLSGTWGGKTRALKKIRSMAALTTGDLLVIDKDYDGLLRCQIAAGSCTPWGSVGKFRVVKVGPADWAFLLDDKGQTVRILDPAQRTVAVLGPIIGAAKMEKIEDVAVDAAYGVYLMEAQTKRVVIVHLRSAGDGKVTPTVVPAVALPVEGDRAVKNPTALGVSPGGWLAVAGKSSPRVMRLR